jgi:hypothetical protein
MTRLERITQHLLAKGAQYNGDVGDKLVTDKFTELTFRRLIPSVRVREYKNGLLEILFVEEMCAGGNRDAWERMPDMDWVLKTIDENVLPQPSGQPTGEA